MIDICSVFIGAHTQAIIEICSIYWVHFRRLWLISADFYGAYNWTMIDICAVFILVCSYRLWLISADFIHSRVVINACSCNGCTFTRCDQYLESFYKYIDIVFNHYLQSFSRHASQSHHPPSLAPLAFIYVLFPFILLLSAGLMHILKYIFSR